MELESSVDGSGAYVIKCTRNGKVYVGSSSVSVLKRRDAKNARHRRNEHRRHLRRIVRRSLIYAWTWPEAEQNAEAQKWIDWE